MNRQGPFHVSTIGLQRLLLFLCAMNCPAADKILHGQKIIPMKNNLTGYLERKYGLVVLISW
jgi:hypothetical protein